MQGEKIDKWIANKQPPYSLDLSPTDFYLFTNTTKIKAV